MKIKARESWWVSIATLGDVRHSPAPGTVASALTIPFILLMDHLDVSLLTYGLVIALFAVFSFIVIEKARVYFDKPDPKEIVLDECLGMIMTFFGIPLSVFSVIAGFLLFRIFDISKLFGIKIVEKLPGTWGILADDVAAGLITMIILRILVPVVCG